MPKYDTRIPKTVTISSLLALKQICIIAAQKQIKQDRFASHAIRKAHAEQRSLLFDHFEGMRELPEDPELAQLKEELLKQQLMQTYQEMTGNRVKFVAPTASQQITVKQSTNNNSKLAKQQQVKQSGPVAGRNDSKESPKNSASATQGHPKESLDSQTQKKARPTWALSFFKKHSSQKEQAKLGAYEGHCNSAPTMKN